MQNDTPVFHAFAYNPLTAQYDIWVGMGTRQAIAKCCLKGDGIVHWCPHQWLIGGWRDR